MLSLIHQSILFYIGIGVTFFGAIIGIDIKFNNLEGELKAKMQNLEEHIETEVNKRFIERYNKDEDKDREKV